MFSDNYSQMAVRIQVGGTKPSLGSGCLFQPHSDEYSYVLTAKHCLIGKDFDNPNVLELSDISIFRDSDFGGEKLNVISYKIHEDDSYDIACIIVKKVNDLPNLLMGEPHRNCEIISYGYPYILNDRNICGQLFEAKIMHIQRNEQKQFTAKVDVGFLTYENDALTNIEGYSGSAVYIQENEGLLIVGVIIELKHPSGVFSEFIVENISSFNEFLLANSLKPLEPSCLSTFDYYFHHAFLGYSEFERSWLKQKLQSSVSAEVTPAKIKDVLREKLLVPYSDYSESVSIHDDLWRGWVLLLVALSHDSNFKLESKDLSSPILLYKTNSEARKDPIHHFFVKRFYNFHDFIEHIVTKDNIYDDIRQDGIIIVNNSGSFKAAALNKSQIKNIITDISQTKPLNGVINIDDPEIDKNISVFHLKKFENIFESVDWNKDLNTIDQELKIELERVFEK
ncbi:ABC-three component system protein [Paenibacillus sp. FSL H8-0317]|uniref:ABC-three component system protein n=1 Tax=unclassified Paenibacillus TaxID=185978 RepID=UPI0030D528CD